MIDFSYRDIESFGEYDFEGFYELMVEKSPVGATLIEVGSFKGRSLCHLGQIARNSGKNLTVIGVDWGRGMGDNFSYPTANDLVQNLVRCNLDDYVHLVLGSSAHAHRLFEPGSAWMVFLDGRHTPPEAVKEDIECWFPIVSDYGFLCGHDYRWNTVCEPVNAMLDPVLHDPKWDNVWLCPKRDAWTDLDADILVPTTIPKSSSDPSISKFLSNY